MKWIERSILIWHDIWHMYVPAWNIDLEKDQNVWIIFNSIIVRDKNGLDILHDIAPLAMKLQITNENYFEKFCFVCISFNFGVITLNSRSPYIDIHAQTYKKKTADQQDRVKIFEAWDYWPRSSPFHKKMEEGVKMK